MSERSDYETAELVLAWLREYGLTIILAVVLSLAMNYGYNWYQNSKEQQRRDASALVLELAQALEKKDAAAAEKLHQNLQHENTSFQQMADLLYGHHLLTEKRYDEALPLLKNAQKSEDIWLSSMAQLYQVHLMMGQKKYDEALREVENLRGGVFHQQVPSIQAVIYEWQGKMTEALQAYQSVPDSIFKTMKISALQAQLLHP